MQLACTHAELQYITIYYTLVKHIMTYIFYTIIIIMMSLYILTIHVHADELPSWRYTDKEQQLFSYRDEQALLNDPELRNK